MKFPDLLAMSVRNLWRRKLRTALTVLGVVVGTASIVVMVSLGIGLREMTVEHIESMGSLTSIQVSSDTGMGSASDQKSEPNYMTDETMEMFSKMAHVKSASPLLSLYVMMKQGKYQGNVSLIGANREYLEQIPIGTGSLPDPGDKQMKMIVGNWVVQQFSDGRRFGSYWETGELPDVDLMNRSVFVIYDMDAYYASRNQSDSGPQEVPPKKYLLAASGVVEGGEQDWNPYCYNAYVDLDLLKAELRRIFKNKPIPGQPVNKKGKPYRYFIYDSAVVNVDNMKNVKEVQKAINDLGFQATSNMEWLEQSQQQAGMVQAVLGGIGAVSLFVAAIGIANTMMMSIYERTKEIGIIKVLGCDMRNIRDMFLIESGFIGFAGGIAGLLLSYLVSFLMNRFVGLSQAMMGVEGDLSRIPPWLALSAVAFAVFVGMAAGFFPSLRAMKLSPLAAIRNE